MSFSAHDHRKESDGSIGDKTKLSMKLSEKPDSNRKSETDKTLHPEVADEKRSQAAYADPSVRVSNEFAGVTIIFRSAIPTKPSDTLGKNLPQAARRKSEFQQSSLPMQYRTDHPVDRGNSSTMATSKSEHYMNYQSNTGH